MDWSKVRSALVTIAPWIAGTFGTPAAGVAVKAICGVLGADSNSATPESIQAAISGATPDQLLALKQADLKHQEFMAQLGYDNLAKLAQATVDDRDSARKRESAVKDRTPAVLAALAVLGFVGLIGVVIYGFTPAEPMRDGFWMLAGAAMVTYKDVYGYYFGSSAGSHAKDATISDLSKPD